MPRFCRFFSEEGVQCKKQTRAPSEFCVDHGCRKRKSAVHEHETNEAPALHHDEHVTAQDASWTGPAYWQWSSSQGSADDGWYSASGWHDSGSNSTPGTVHFTVVNESQSLYTDGRVLYRMVAVPWSTLCDTPPSTSCDLPVMELKQAYLDCPAPPAMDSGKKAHYPMSLQGFKLDLQAFKRFLQNHKDNGPAQVSQIHIWFLFSSTYVLALAFRKYLKCCFGDP